MYTRTSLFEKPFCDYRLFSNSHRMRSWCLDSLLDLCRSGRVTLKSVRDFFYSKKAYMFDLDGTLYLGKRLIPGSRDLIHRLDGLGKQIVYFTNNSSRSDLDYVRKLKKFGFPVRRDQVVMSTHSLIRWMKDRRWKSIFLLGTPSMKKMIEREGLVCRDNGSVDGVVCGFDKTLRYEKLKTGCRLIERGTPWVVTHPDRFCPTDEGLEPDCGAMAALIEAATSRAPEDTLGKPHPLMVKLARDRFPIAKRDWILIGDRLSTDIQMATKSSIDSLLVLSGETRRQDLRGIGKAPFMTISSVHDLL